MAKKLFVGSLPWEVTDGDLNELFAQAGTVMSATVIMDKQTGRSKGFGFVEYGTDEEATKAIEMFNGHKMGDRSIVVNEARPMTDRPPHRPGSGGFGGGARRDFRGGGQRSY